MAECKQLRDQIDDWGNVCSQINSHSKPDRDEEKAPASEFLTNFFDNLSERAPQRSLSKDLESFRAIFCEVMKLKKQNVLSDEETEALVYFLASKVAQNRFDRTFSQLLPNSRGRWFLAHHRFRR
jgi:hypothetical protein